jgi:glycosyltransferase involved in cell wall biosynthesis
MTHTSQPTPTTQKDSSANVALRPLVSIIMPSYNAGKFIEKAVQSVLAQTYQAWELIVVDDASTDNTEALMAQFTDSRIRYHQVERIGHPAGVRNTGLRMATGEFIAFLDSDDLYYPQTLEKLLRPLLQNPALTAVYGFAFSMDENENTLPQSVSLLPNPQADTAAGESPYLLPPHYSHTWESIVTGQISCMLAGLMLRREVWERIGFFNETLCGPEDYEFYVRMFLHHYDGVYCLSDYVYKYRVHSASLTKAPEHCQRVLASCLKIMDWMFNEAPLPAQAHHYKSLAYMDCYRYLARERLLNHQPGICRQIIGQAWQDRNIAPLDFIRHFTPLMLRSWLPTGFDTLLVKLRWQLRQIKYSKAQNAQVHAR